MKVECIRTAPAVITAQSYVGYFLVNSSCCGVNTYLVWVLFGLVNEFISGCNLIRKQGRHWLHGTSVVTWLQY